MHSRLYSLLLLRVVATLLVVFGHASSFFKGFLFTQWPQFVYVQNIAVVLFFCVSGYTIAWVCDSRRSDSAGRYGAPRFVFDRYMRLAIPLLPVIALTVVANVAAFGLADQPYSENFDLRVALGNLGFLQRLEIVVPFVGQVTDIGIEAFSTNRPLWTLGLEFWLYVLYGTLALRSRGTGASVATVAIGLLALALLSESLFGPGASGLPIVWMLGALLYHGMKRLSGPKVIWSLALLPVWALVATALFIPVTWPENGGYSHLYNVLIFANFAFFVLLFPLRGGESRSLDLVVTFFGSFAYTAYLVHYPVMVILSAKGILPQGSERSVIAAALLGLAVAYLVSLPFEQRYKQIRDWVWRTGADRLAPT